MMREPLCLSPKGLTSISADLLTSAVEDLETVDLGAVSFLMIDLSDWHVGYRLLKQIRGHLNPCIYTKPALFFGTPDDAPRDVLQAADGHISLIEDSFESVIISWSSRVEFINKRINQLKEMTPDGDNNIAFKVLRFLQTRNTDFKPIPSTSKTSGYIYPKLEPLFPKQDVGVLETLEYLESQKLVSGQFRKKSYACTHCGCAFLNFYEICPDCGSSDLYTDELIHHFKCAYVGELSDFRQGQNLVCPKCGRNLKNIGVDYDKASVVYHCRACSNVFQEPLVMTSCYDCWREALPENQVLRDIKTYTVTSIGENAARYGMDSLLKAILETKIHAISFDVFKEFFRLEIARIERYKMSRSCLAVMRLQNIDQIYGRLGKRATEFFNELSDVFKSGLRSSDIFSVRDETVFLVILTETPKKNAELAISRLEKRIISLLATNLKIEIKVDKVVLPLSTEVDLEKTIEKFLQAHDS